MKDFQVQQADKVGFRTLGTYATYKAACVHLIRLIYRGDTGLRLVKGDSELWAQGEQEAA